MIALIVFLFCVLVALGTGLVAAWSDFKGLVIPNICHVLIAGAFALALLTVTLFDIPLMKPAGWHVAAGALVLVVTFIMFSLRVFGGGDAKLLSAYALWAGFTGLPVLLFYMGVAGALLGIYALVIKKRKPFKAPRPEGWIARLQNGESRVPYGIAIVTGALAAFLEMGYLSIGTFSLFLDGGGL